ncbi:MAG TPA: hypothetical protein PLP01_13705 [Phycisphaerae bacterium]|nr:hypothetical protein [Phycisphaerae bacterium]HOI56299.1 hypothetical protein [Phycisphaerae bacterium]
MRAFSVCLCAALAVVVAGAAGCGEPRNPAAAIPLDAGVSLTSMDVREEIELPPHLARAFVTMVHGRPNRSSITSTPSEPMGWFRVAGNTFYLHGGTVVLGEGDDERS